MNQEGNNPNTQEATEESSSVADDKLLEGASQNVSVTHTDSTTQLSDSKASPTDKISTIAPKVQIFHAFSGFLYAPLFLADKLGYFPQCAELIPTGSDESTISAVRKKQPNILKMGVCDPLTKLKNQQAVEGGDSLVVIGTMINKLPFWLLNSNTRINCHNSEEELSRYGHNAKDADAKLQRIVCYKSTTTGYVIGERLRKDILNLDKGSLTEVNFGDEFDGNYGKSTDVIITSDILRLSWEKIYREIEGTEDPDWQIYDYLSAPPKELNPYLFTSILTLEEQVHNDNLWLAVTVLTGIDRAIRHLTQADPSDGVIELLVEQFTENLKQIKVPESQYHSVIRRAIGEIQQIYPRDTLRPSKIAWENAGKAWKSAISSTKLPKIEDVDKPIPALLIQDNWKSNTAILNHYLVNCGVAHLFKEIPGVRWLNHIVRVVIVSFALFCLGIWCFKWRQYMSTEMEDDSMAFAGIMVAGVCTILVAYSSYTIWKLYERIDQIEKQNTLSFWQHLIVLIAFAVAIFTCLAFVK